MNIKEVHKYLCTALLIWPCCVRVSCCKVESCAPMALFLVLALISNSGEGCQIDSSLQGEFIKQPDDVSSALLSNGVEETITYDKVTITSSSVSSWGNCYENSEHSFVFGMKRIGDPMCYRCITLLLRSPNVIQAAHQIGNPCKDTIEEARKTCFDANAISASEGTFLYRIENAEATSCGLEGAFDMSFMKAESSLTCDKPGSFMSSCEMVSRMSFQFRNCSFPDFDMNLLCIGSWKGNSRESLIAVQDDDSKQLKCGVLTQSTPAEITLYLSKDASCNALSLNGANAAEIYTLRQRETRENWAACNFPEWLQGEYESVSIADKAFSYSARTSESIPTISYCVAIDGQRIAVFSESKCGEFIGFHCLWFRSRSDSLVEFKTTDRRDDDDGELCSDESAFDFSPWTAIVAKQPDPVSCGFEGTYVTPSYRRHTDCYSLAVDCTKKHLMKVTAFSCETGAVSESRRYTCLGSWTEQGYLFVYTERAYEKANVCFVTREHKGVFYVSTSGAHCQRNYNFTLNSDKTIVLERETDCTIKPRKENMVKPPVPARPLQGNSVMLPGDHSMEYAHRHINAENNTLTWVDENSNGMRVITASKLTTCLLIFFLRFTM